MIKDSATSRDAAYLPPKLRLNHCIERWASMIPTHALRRVDAWVNLNQNGKDKFTAHIRTS